MSVPIFGVAGKTNDLDRQHRKDARHQVQDHAAEQRAQQGSQQTQARLCRRSSRQHRLRCASGTGAQLGPVTKHLQFSTVALTIRRQYHRHDVGRIAALLGQRHLGAPYPPVPALRPLRRGLNHFRRFRKKFQCLAAQRQR